MEGFNGHVGQFRHPLSDEQPIRIALEALLDGVVNADGVDAGHAGLHLKLTEVNPRFKIEKAPRQMLHAGLPGVVEVVRQKADQHGAHAKIQIPRFGHAAHARVDERDARLPSLPGFEGFGGAVVGEIRIAAVHTFKFYAAFRLKLLDEVPLPAQSATKRLEVHFGPRHFRRPVRLVHLPHAEASPC